MLHWQALPTVGGWYVDAIALKDGKRAVMPGVDRRDRCHYVADWAVVRSPEQLPEVVEEMTGRLRGQMAMVGA